MPPPCPTCENINRTKLEIIIYHQLTFSLHLQNVLWHSNITPSRLHLKTMSNNTLINSVKDAAEDERGSATWWNKPIIPFIPEAKDPDMLQELYCELRIAHSS